jgi:CHAT domain-containing protein
MKTTVVIILLVLPALLLAQPSGNIDALLIEGDFQNALLQIEERLATATPDDAYVLLNKKAEALTRAGKFDEAEKVLREISSTSLSDYQGGLIKTNFGYLHLNRGRNDLALENLKDALNAWDRCNKMQSLEAAQTQAHLGNLFRSTGQYAEAEQQLNMALLTRQKILSEQHELIAASMNDLGLLYSQFDPDRALTYYEKALAIYEQLHGKNHPKIAITNTNTGYIYTKMELFGDAINNFEAALSVWNSVYPGPHPSKGFVLFSLGQTNEKMKNLEAAREYYLQAVKIYQDSYTGKHPEIARVYNALGNLDQAENKFTTALQYYQAAMTANHPSFRSADITVNPNVKEFYDGNVLLYSLMNKAQVLELNYYRRSLRFKELLLALRTLRSCDTLIDHLRQQTRNESDKIALGGIATEVYADGVRISSGAAVAAWNKNTFRELAFYFAEKSKAAVLLGAITDANAKSFAGIPASLLEEEKRLKAALALVAQKLAQVPTLEEEQYLRQTFYELNRSYEIFSKNLETEFPAYYNLKYNSAAATIPQLKQRLDERSLLISYFTDEKNNRLYIFKVTRSGLDVEEKALPEKFERNLAGLRNSLFFSDLSTYRKSASALSAVLIPKISSRISDLIIIPDAKLGTIPFETLFTADATNEHTFQTLPYLIDHYSIRYEFSSGLIMQKGMRKNRESPSILLCAPVTFQSSGDFSDLPATEAEVTDISEIFANRNYDANLLLRGEAVESNIKTQDLKKYSLVHFATHGVVDEKNPELSRIFLYANNTGSEDGTLYTGEIYNLELNADLVTLSACQTGLGKISKGEGVIGLSRALVFAGARSCLVSFWKVADESTALLMKHYYTILLQKGDYNYSATLQQAKKKLIHSDNYSAPFYWAPFILIGF